MAGTLDAVFAIRITRSLLERLPAAELDDAARGILFIPAPAPPRVGTRVQVEVTFEEDRGVRHSGLVVWARPAQRGQLGGFRAQLESPGPTLLRRIKAVTDSIRNEHAARPSFVIEAPIRERVSYRTPSNPMRAIEASIDIDVSFMESTAVRSRSRIRAFRADQRTLPPLRPGLPGPDPSASNPPRRSMP